MTDDVVGHIGNVSETGMLVMASAPLVVDALYQLRFDLTNGAGQGRRSKSARTCSGGTSASAPGQAWAGLPLHHHER